MSFSSAGLEGSGESVHPHAKLGKFLRTAILHRGRERESVKDIEGLNREANCLMLFFSSVIIDSTKSK